MPSIPRFRVMVLVGAFAGLRLGEMLALTRERLDLEHGRIKVVEQYQQLKDGTNVLGPPKSAAGVRTVADGEVRTVNPTRGADLPARKPGPRA